jgi:pSer/pThr/pTyr-binding forkhead associated (FHA) protein
VIVQELLEALNKAQIETNLNPLAVWAISKYLQGVWRDSPGKTVRPYELGRAMSNFFVDLSEHQLPEKIWKQTPETEPMLLKFFGVGEGSLAHFWSQCKEIWNVTLEPFPTFARDVNIYFEMLLQSSLQDRRPRTPTVPILVSLPSVEPSSVPASMPPSPVLAGAVEVTVQAPVLAPEIPPSSPEGTMSPLISKSEAEQKAPAGFAYLVLHGSRIIPLTRAMIKIGRQLDNHIILEDPRVSRTHAQLRLINDRFVIIDMNSTGGTFINGQRTTQSILYPGDVISLAGVKFVFSQEAPARPGDMKIIELGSSLAADRPTAVMHREEIQQAVKAKKELPDLPKTGPLRS